MIDTKNYTGKVEQRDVGGWLGTDIRLFVNGRDRTTLIDGMNVQTSVVRRVLATHRECEPVPVTPVLLFRSHDNWSLFARRPLRFGDVYALWGRALGKLVRAGGPIGPQAVLELERRLAARLPAA